GPRRPRRHLRRRLAVQPHRAGPGSVQLPGAAGPARQHEGHAGLRLRRPLRRGGARDGRLDGRRQAQVARGRRQGPRDLPRRPAQALPGRELRQAGARSGLSEACGLGGYTWAGSPRCDRGAARTGRVALIQERATGRDGILAVAENMRSSLEPLVTKTIAPSLYQVYLHSADYERLRTIFGELEAEAKELLERELARLNRGASTAAHRLLAPLRAWRRGRG